MAHGSPAVVVVTGGDLSDLYRLVRRVLKMQEKLMADFTALNSALDAHNTALSEAVQRVSDDVRALNDKIAELELDSDDQAAVDAATSRVQASVDALNAVDPVAPVAPEEPEQPAEPQA